MIDHPNHRTVRPNLRLGWGIWRETGAINTASPASAIPALGQAPEGTREWAGNPSFSRIRFRLWTPALPRLRRKSPKVSGLLRKYSRFGETMGGDRFDHDCRPRGLVGSAVTSPPLTATLFTGR